MEKVVTFLFLFLLAGISVFAQVAINTDNSPPNSSAGLDVNFTNKGFLPPRMTTVQMNAIVNPASGLCVFCTDGGPSGTGALEMFMNGAWYTFLATCSNPAVPVPGNCIPSAFQIIWNWNTVPGATGYKWNATNDYATAMDMGTTTTMTETNLMCNTPYWRYVWAYNGCGHSDATNLMMATILNPIPVVTISASAAQVCEGTLVTFTANDPYIVPLTYGWIVNYGIVQSFAQDFTYAPSNNDVIICMITSNMDPCTEHGFYNSNPITMTVYPYLPVSLSISASANPVCAGTPVVYTATPANGGTNPAYQWKVNGTNVTGATNATYEFVPTNSNAVTCVLTSSEICTTGNPATSNTVTITVNPVPATPTAGTHVPLPTQIIWKWNTVTGASGYKWSTANSYAGATDMGTAITKTETGLTCGTPYTRYVWAYNGCGYSLAASLNQSTGSCSSFSIGQTYGGGIIFYIDGTGQHGLISATTDQSTGIIWAVPACQTTSVPGGTSTAIGSGAANTDKIIAQNGAGTAYAAGLARSYTGGGNSDWFLPSKDELNLMYAQKTAIGSFASNSYWSSSEYSASYAWYQYLVGTGYQNYYSKDGTFSVRAVRTF